MRTFVIAVILAGCASATSPQPAPSTHPSPSASAAASSAPDDSDAKATFVARCVDREPRKGAYCGCVWTTLRKTLDASDVLGDPKGPAYDAARKDVAVACHGTLPEEVAKAHYVDDCPTQYAAMCRCVWTALRARSTTEEIASGLVDAKPAIEVCKASVSP